MLISKADVRFMIEQILADERFGYSGHYPDKHRAKDLVTELGQYLKEALLDTIFIPDDCLRWLQGSVIGDIAIGAGRPLHYLCSDCRYPKWFLTPDEAERDGYKDFKIRPDGFSDRSGACPKCGD